MTEREEIRAMVTLLTKMGEPAWGNKLIVIYDDIKARNVVMNDKFTNGQNYLMGVTETKLTVTDALKAFGFGDNRLAG